MNHLGIKELEANILILRRFELSDVKTVFENWANDPDVTKYLMWQAHKDINVSESVLSEWVSKYNHDAFYQWAIVLKSNGNEPGSGVNTFFLQTSKK